MSETLFARLAPELEKLDIRTEKALCGLDRASDPTFKCELLKHERHDTFKDLNKLDKLMGTMLQLDEMTAWRLRMENRQQQLLVPSGIWATGAPTMWKQGITGRTCLVGVIDTGIDRKHPDLKDKVVIARDYVNDSVPMERWDPHGTHVAGTIAAKGKIMGMAPNCKLADYRVLGENGGSPLNVTRAIYQATLDGCKVINLSLGSRVEYRPMHAAIQNAVRNGVMVVVAVGNSGDGSPATEEINYPGYYPEVCGAGAVQFVTRSDVAESIKDAYFSNTNKEVDVAAPGWQVLSTLTGGGYGAMSGTSMAAPHVSGFAALLYDKVTIRTQQILLPEMLFAMVKSTTVDIRDVGIDVTTGAGFITFYPAVPMKKQGKWLLDEMELGKPEIGTAGNPPQAAVLSKEVELRKRHGMRMEAASTSGVTS